MPSIDQMLAQAAGTPPALPPAAVYVPATADADPSIPRGAAIVAVGTPSQRDMLVAIEASVQMRFADRVRASRLALAASPHLDRDARPQLRRMSAARLIPCGRFSTARGRVDLLSSEASERLAHWLALNTPALDWELRRELRCSPTTPSRAGGDGPVSYLSDRRRSRPCQ